MDTVQQLNGFQEVLRTNTSDSKCVALLKKKYLCCVMYIACFIAFSMAVYSVFSQVEYEDLLETFRKLRCYNYTLS